MKKSSSMICLLLLLPNELLPNDDFEEWLGKDNFDQKHLYDRSKKYLFDELNKAKLKFKEDLLDSGVLKDEAGNNLNPLQIYRLVEGHKNRINKIRLAISPEYSIARNLHRNNSSLEAKDVYYLVARAYWINNDGKKFRKFSKNLGAEDKVKINGEIPQGLLNEIEKNFELMMWEEYQNEYKLL
jgi:hypothetical protein